MGSIVVDIGGTNLRLAYFENDKLHDVRRVAIESFLSSPDAAPAELYAMFSAQLEREISGLLNHHPAAKVGIAFPGPVDLQGRAARAPTLWGDKLSNVDLRFDLEQLFDREVHVLNDISAAAWRYAKPNGKDFCLITVSSGIGNKVFRKGEILLNDQGYGGEIGHCRVADGPDMLPCDCGGHGHLGGLASGRGTLQLARHYAGRYPQLLADSSLAARPSDNWSTYDLVAALKADDAFAWKVCDAAQSYLLAAMRQLYHWIGICHFIFIGGFVTAIGQRYIDELNQKASKDDWFGMTPSELACICVLGESDDDHSLIGMGRYLARGEHG
ncbi:MAG: ROK family protein [Pseudomonadota bacterium]